MYNVAVFYLKGKGRPRNEELGMSYMKSASKERIKEVNTTFSLSDDIEVIRTKFLLWSNQACTYMGVHYGKNAEFDKAMDMFQKAAAQEVSLRTLLIPCPKQIDSTNLYSLNLFRIRKAHIIWVFAMKMDWESQRTCTRLPSFTPKQIHLEM